MFEVIALIFLCSHIGDKVRAKGRKALGFQLLTILLWVGLEISGAVTGALAHSAYFGRPDSWLLSLASVGAIGGAVLGGTIGFKVADRATPIESHVSP